MKTRKLAILFLAAAFAATAGAGASEGAAESAVQKKPDVLQGTIPGLKVDNLMTEKLESVEGREVIVSHVEIPANTTLPRHWHPGEEFIYVLEGSAILWQEDRPDTHLSQGDVFKVPLKQVHTAKTGDEGATVLVFRVHEHGQPVRVNVE